MSNERLPPIAIGRTIDEPIRRPSPKKNWSNWG